MLVHWRRTLVVVVAAAALLGVASAAGSAASSTRLTGTWSGEMSGSYVKSHPLRIVVDASERGGSWKISATCQGPLKLKDISNGFHHYTEELAPGATCLGGGVDCLKRAGPNLYDEFQSRPGTSYDSDGILRRVATPTRSR